MDMRTSDAPSSYRQGTAAIVVLIAGEYAALQSGCNSEWLIGGTGLVGITDNGIPPKLIEAIIDGLLVLAKSLSRRCRLGALPGRCCGRFRRLACCFLSCCLLSCCLFCLLLFRSLLACFLGRLLCRFLESLWNLDLLVLIVEIDWRISH